MNKVQIKNLRELLATGISTYSPEYVSQSEEADKMLSNLLDSIEKFDEDCKKQLEEEKLNQPK